MFETIQLKFANALEKKARRIKGRISKKRKTQFMDQYGLSESKGKTKRDVRFNTYEGTSIILCDKLISSGIINENDIIFDIGCGTGIFLIYLASKRIRNLRGIEYDLELYDICKKIYVCLRM